MTRKRKGNSPGPVAVRTEVIKKRSGPQSESARGPRPMDRIVEFPAPPAADDVVSDRIIFEVGGSRFAITWTAEIEQLPPAGPVAVESGSKTRTTRPPLRKN